MKINPNLCTPTVVGLLLGVFCNLSFCVEAPAGTVLELEGLRVEFAKIAAGSFKQGSPPEESKRNPDEKQRDVTITREFFIGKFPVTVALFTRFIMESKYQTEAERGTSGGYGIENGALIQKKEYTWRNPGFIQLETHPVVMVTHGDALAFCQWLSKKTRREITLPTEAQWEFACRAGTTTRFYNGDADSDVDEIAWHKDNANGTTQPVGLKKPNAFGLFDMSGGVYEWCLDWYGEYTEGSQSDPLAAEPPAKETPRRVLRGGSFFKDSKNCRSAARYRNDAKSRNADNGFRIVMAPQKLEREDNQK